MIVIGVDAHKATHTLVCVNGATGEQLGELTADANSDGHQALREPDLPRARLAGPEREIALLVDYRADLVAESTRLQGRLRWLLHDLAGLEPSARGLSNDGILVKLGRSLARREPTVQVRICREHVGRLRELWRQIKSIERDLLALVRRHGAELLAIPGCGVITAARLIA